MLEQNACICATKKCNICSLTVRENKWRYTKRQNAQADRACEYQRKLEYSTEQQLIKLINHNKLTNNSNFLYTFSD
jgi:protease II